MHKQVNMEDQRLAFTVKQGEKWIKRWSLPDGPGWDRHLLKEMLPVHINIPSDDLLFGLKKKKKKL